MTGFGAGYSQVQDRGSIIRQRAQQIAEGEQRLQQAKMQLQAEAAAMQGLGAPQQQQPQPSMQMQPQQGPQPGPQPQMRPQMPPGGQPGGGMPQAGGGQPGMPQAPPGPPGASGGASQVKDPAQILQGIAQRIKQANPNIDPATLFRATAQTVGLMKGLDNESKMLLETQLKMAQLDQKYSHDLQVATTATQIAQLKADHADAQKQLWAMVATRGQDVRADTTKRGQDIRVSEGEKNRDARSALRSQMDDRIDARAQGKTAQAAQYKALMAKRMDIKDQIQIAQQAGDQGTVNELAPQLKQADVAVARFWSSNQYLPKPSELANEKPAAGIATSEVGATPKKAPKPKAGEVEMDLPPDDIAEPKTQAEYDALPKGAKFKDSEGVKVKP